MNQPKASERRAKERRKVDRSWHLKKEISVGHIATTLSIACAVLWWAHETESRMDVIEVRHQAMVERIDRSERSQEQQFGEIRELLKEIRDKLDRKVDR